MRLAKIIPTIGLTGLVLALAACDKGPNVSATNATPAEVQAKLDAAGGTEAMVNPGRWEGTTTMQMMQVPGLPPEMQAEMAKQIDAPKPFISCVTEEDVKDRKGFFAGNPDAKTCKYDKFELGGGKVSAAVKCNRGEEGRMEMTMSGDYTANSYRMTMNTKAEGKGPMDTMVMKMTVDAKRTGVCKGTADEGPAKSG